MSADGPLRLGRLEAVVRGNVQGVGFRWFVQRIAEQLDLGGWVANLPDGSVQVVAEGPDPALDALLDALREGPAAASVWEVEVRRGPGIGGPRGFSIRAGAHRGD